MKRIWIAMLAGLLALSAVALAAPEADRAGNPITLPEKVERIVSMAPSTTQVLIDLGVSDQIVALDTYSAMYEPELAEGLPQFDMMTPDAEQIAALTPDVVFITGMSLSGGDNPYQALINIGIPVVVIPSSSSIAGIEEDIAFIGECVGKPEEAQNLIASMQNDIEAIRAIGETIQEKKTFAVEVAALHYLCCVGSGTYFNEMLEMIGAVNAYGDQEGWVSLTEEAAVAANPDVILTTIDYLPDPVEEILSREGWSEVTAIANGDVYQIDSESSNQPNHRIIKALWEMAQAVYPEAFSTEAAA